VAKHGSTLAPRNVVVGTLCIVAAAALVMSRQSSVVNWVADVDAAGKVQHIEQVDSFDPSATAAPQREVVSPRTPRAAAVAPAADVPSKRAEPASSSFQYVPPTAAGESAPRIVPASLRSTEAEAEAPAPASPAQASDEAAAAVPATITGCLAREENSFWLKNVSGADAPKARSWKSGFLRRKSSNVELVDRGNGNRLAAYVGRRIETNGVLLDHEMRVKSLRVLGSCE
jgi:hypothetical protein